MKTNNNETVPYIFHEAAQARLERVIKPERSIKSIVYKHDDIIMKFVKTLKKRD